MIKFLRKMRMALIPESRFGKYLLYAFGEIIIVVVGILFALSINNWNEQRKEDQAEHKALENLEQDFHYNLDKISDQLARATRIISENLRLLQHTGNKYNPESGFIIDSVINYVATSPHYYPRNGFLDDLLNSGNLGIIKNEELRQLLSSWNPALEYLKQREDNCDELNNIIELFISQHGCWLNYDSQYQDYDFDIPKSGFEFDNNTLLMSLEFENHVDNHIYYLNNLKERQKPILELAENILQLIDNELRK